ncbi:hypothetical protein THAOC_10572, partial [Thalassiosira oceanica]
GDERASDEATPLTTEAATGDGRAGGRAVRRRWRPKANGARGEGRHGHFLPPFPNDAEGAEGPGKDGASPSGWGGRKATCPAPPLPGNGTALLRPGTSESARDGAAKGRAGRRRGEDGGSTARAAGHRRDIVTETEATDRKIPAGRFPEDGLGSGPTGS